MACNAQFDNKKKIIEKWREKCRGYNFSYTHSDEKKNNERHLTAIPLFADRPDLDNGRKKEKSTHFNSFHLL